MLYRTAGVPIALAAMLACSSNGDTPPSSPQADKVAKVAKVTPKAATNAVIGPKADVWVPAENQKGIKKFKDPGFYVDGVPKGILRFGELPIDLKPVWHKERASLEFHGKGKKQFEIVEQRRYRFLDYLEVMGVDIKKVKALHIYGGAKRKVAVTIPGSRLRNAKEFMFRFGSDVFGKAIPACPLGLTNGNCPDNINAIAVYVTRKPPTKKGGTFYLDGQRIDGIPYFGDPLRGGVRVYLDGPLAAHIKRNLLWKLRNETFKVTTADGKTRWKFFEFLKSQGVKTDEIVEAWLIRHDRRVKRIGRDELLTATFAAAEKKGGQILFGKENAETNSIALHTRRIKKKELPVIRPHEQHR